MSGVEVKSEKRCSDCGCSIREQTYFRNGGRCRPCSKKQPQGPTDYLRIVWNVFIWLKIRVIIAVIFVSLLIANLNFLGWMRPFRNVPDWVWHLGLLLLPVFLFVCAWTDLSRKEFAKKFADWMWTIIYGTGFLMLISFFVQSLLK